jgi:glycosyltransferase involved in cell wall biosynthesis
MADLQAEGSAPLVSVVVPTVGGSPWLRQAVQSVLRQSYSRCEVVMVDDSADGFGGCPRSLEWALQMGERLRVIHSRGVGGSEARNAGVKAAMGDWIAFLDDDDEWMPEKLQRQMEVALRAEEANTVVSCRVVVKTPSSEYVFPRRVYRGEERIEEYLFCRKGWAVGGGFVQTSTLLARRELLLRVPFAAGLVVHQDWDWLLRVSPEEDVRVRMLEEPLVVYRTEDGRATVSRRADWRTSLNWVRGHAWRMEPRAFSWFVAVQCAWKARAAGASRREWAEIVRSFCFEGRPTVRAAMYFAFFAWFPTAWRKRVRDVAWRRSTSARDRNGGERWRLASRPRA